MAELIAAYSPPMPNPVRNRKRKNHQGANDNAVSAVASQVHAERDHEQLLAAEPVGEPAEEQRAQAGAGDVDRGAEAGDRAWVMWMPLPGLLICPEMFPTMVTSRPSRIQTVPRPITILQ